MKHNTHFKQWLAIVIGALTMTATTAKADFADDINATTNKYGYGHRVIYEMNVGGFTTAGTFAAAQAKLTELKLTGVDVIWLMPIYPRQSTSPGLNSPYGPVSYTKTNPSYGTIAQLKSFVDRAHELNMEVWLDWVPNHTATNAEWVTDSVPTNYYKYSGGSIVHPNSYSDVIQLDYSKQTLRNSMDYAMKFWIREAGIDGYRCDYISSSEIPADYWTWQIPRLRNYAASLGKSNFWMLGEANFLDNTAKKLFNTGWDYDYMWNFFEPTLTGMGSGTDASTLKTRLTNHFNQSEYSNLDRMAYLNNHDEDWNDKATMTSRYGDNRYAFNVLIFTFYGMPLIYNGQEIGYSQNLDYFHDTKINWNSVDNKMKNTIRTLTALKHNVEAFQDGKTFAERGSFSLFSTSNSVVAYKRAHGDSEAIVVLNLGSSAATVSLSGVTAGSYELCLNSSTIASGVSKESVELTASPTINVEARGYRVYVKGSIGITQKTYSATLEGSETAINKATFTMNATVDDNTDTGRQVYGYYTTDGTEPTTASTAIRHGDVITIDEDCTLKFRYRTNNLDETLSSTVTKNVSISYSTSENYSNYKNNIPAGSGITVFLKTNHANPVIWGWKTEGGADLNPGETWPGNTVTNTTESGWLYKTFATDNLTFKCADNGANETGSVTITENSHFLYVDNYLIKLDEYNQTADNKYVYFAQLGETDWANVSCYAWGWGTHNGNTVFVDDQTGWGDNLRLYCWYGDTTLSGSWPGWSATGTISYNGTNTYKYFDLGVSSGDQHLFFNNNGSNQIEYYNYNTSSNGLISLTSSSASLGTLGNAEPFGVWGSTGGRVLTKIGTLYDSTGNTHNVMRLDASGAIAGVSLIFNNNAQGTQAADASCEFGRLYYATTAISSSTSLSTLSLPNGTKQEESIDTHVIPPHINGDDTYLLSPTWTGSTTTKDNVVDWTGKSVTVNTPAQNTAATQTVTVPAAATYMVQAIVRATAGKTITLSLNGSSQTITAIGMGNGTASQVDHNGRVDALYTGTTGGWQKIEKSVTLAKDASLTISLMSDAASNEFQFSDVTLLKNPNTAGMFYTTAATTEATPFADLSNVNKFSFFDRGSNLNGLVVLGSSAVQNISGHEHPVNTIIKDGDNYTCQHLMFTDTDDSGQSWNNRNAFATNVAFTADKVSFNRQFAKQHTTLCLPYSLTAAQLNSLFGTNTWYAYKGVSENGSNIVFEEKTNTATIANQPLLIIPGNNGQLMGNGIEGEFAVSPMGTLSDTGFLPTYCWMEGYNDANYAYYLFNTEGNCVKVGNEGFDTKPFRAYIKIPASAAKETLMLEIETPAQEQTTYINNVEATSNGSNITYNTLGQIVGNSYRGIVIKNGKKTIQ